MDDLSVTIQALQERLAKCEADSQQSAKIQSALYKVAEAASSATDMREFYGALHGIVSELMYARNFFIAEYDQTTGLLSFPYFVDEVEATPPAPQPMLSSPGATGYVLRTGQITHYRRNGIELIQRGEFELLGAPSEDSIFVPLRVGDRLLGVMAIQIYEAGVPYYTQQDEDLLAFVGQHIATALTRARAIEETRQRNAELAIINSVQAGLGSKLEFQAIVDLVGDKVRELFHSDTTYVFLLDRQAGLIRRPYYVERGHRNNLEPVPLGQGLTSVVITTASPLLVGTTAAIDALNLPVTDVPSPDQEKDLNETYLGVPILVGDEVIGVVSAQSYEQHAYGENDVRLLQTLANAMGVALENAHLFDETQRLLKETEQRAAELAIINSVQQGLSSRLDMQAIFDLVGDKIHEVFPDAQEVGIVLYDAATDLFHPMYALERGVRLEIAPWKPVGFRQHVLATRQVMVINRDAERLSAEFHNPVIAGERAKSFVFVPMLVAEQVTGIIELQHIDREDAFSDADVRLLQTLASSMSVALENARLFDEVQRRNREISEALEQQTGTSDILRVIAQSPTDVQPVLDAVAATAARLCDTYDAQIVRVQGDVLRVVAHWGPLDVTEPGNSGFPLDRTSVTGRAILEKRPIHVQDVLAEPEAEYPLSRDFSRSMGQRTLLAVPLMHEGNAIGAIIAPRLEVRPFTDKQIALLNTFADQAVIAIQNARLFDEVQSRNREISEALEQQTATAEILTVIASSPGDIQPVLDAVAQSAARLCESYDAAIARVDGDVYRVVAHYGPVPVLRDQVDKGVPVNGESVTGRSILEQRPIQVTDVLSEAGSEYPLSQESSRVSGQRTLLSMPLMREGKAIGAVFVRRQEVRPFSQKHINLLKTFADQAAIAIENVRLFNETTRLLKETEQRAAELAIINGVQEGLSSKLDMQGIYDLVGDKIRDIFDSQAVTICHYDRQTNQLEFPYYLHRGQRLVSPPITFGTGLTSRVIETRQPLLINEDAEQRYVELGAHFNVTGEDSAKSWVGVPITSGTQATGAVILRNTDRENAYSESDVRLLQTLAASMGIALENAQLFESERQRAAELAAINTVSQAMVGEPNLERLIQLIGDQLLGIFSPDIAYVALLDEQTGMINMPYRHGDDTMRPLKLGEGLASKIIETGEPLLINRDVAKKADELGAQRIGKHAVSYLGVPILAANQSIGVISIQSTHQEDVFNEGDLRLLSTIAANAGAAILTARLHAEAQRRAQEMSALTEVGRELAASLDAAVVLEKVAARAEELLTAETSAVFLVQPDQKSMRVATVMGKLAGLLRADTILLGEGIIGALALEGRSEFVNDTSKDARGVKIPGTQNEAGVERLMATPLLRGEQVIGMMAVWRSGEPYADADLNFLSGLARQASIALENARLFAEIKAEKQYSEALVKNSPVAIVSIDEKASVVAWNPGAEQLFGYSASEALGRNIDGLVANHPDLIEEALGYTAAEQRGEPIRAITKRTRKDGMLVDVELAGVPVTVDDERVGWIGIFHDITELLRAREQAIAANEAKSAFLATMSHEIRTPMNAVIGMSGLLMDTSLSKEQQEYAETIRNSGDALLAIINDILDFSKIEAGKMELESQPFDLRECVESALDLVAGRAVEKNIDLAYIIDDGVPVGIKGDVTRLRQILLNLLSNAVKFTESGEVVLTVKRDERPGQLRFAVRDTGIGIPANRMGRLFESFSQADSSTTRRFGGTGLGLAISKRLAEMMGGEMWAESAGAGHGATFAFRIRCTEAAVAARKTTRDLTGLQPALERKRVLIVDDNDTNRRILMLQTQKWGMIPRQTTSPREALKWLKGDQACDLAIFDMQMPEMDGIMLTREVRRLKARNKLPVILLTSLGRNEAGTGDLEFAAHLTKPLKPSALFDALAGIFASRSAVRTAEPARPLMDISLGKRHPLRILLAEDNAVNQKLALRLLEQMGYRADVASNGVEAVESVERQPYDVILMDVQMPELDGLDATRAIRKLPGISQPRVIAMTANAMQGDREMCLAAGMDDYVSKPIRVQELQEALLSSRGGETAAAVRPRRQTSTKAPRRSPVRPGRKAPTPSTARARAAAKSRKT